MTHKLILITTIIFLLLPVNIFGDTATIDLTNGSEYNAIRLTPNVYNNTYEDLSDIIIIDENDKQVPYFINSYVPIVRNNPEKTYELTLSNVDLSNIKQESVISFLAEPDKFFDVEASSIVFETDAVIFAKNVKLEGSFDGFNWDFVKLDTLYRVDNSQNLSLVFDSPLKYNYYKLTVFDNAEEIFFNKAFLKYNQTVVDKQYFSENFSPKFVQEEVNDYTYIKVYGVKNLKINTLKINTESIFKKNVEYAKNYKLSIYNQPLGSNFYKNTTLNFSGYLERDDILVLKIFNEDKKPIKVDSIDITYITDEIIFRNDGSHSYIFSFNNELINSSIYYHIVNYKSLILKEGYSILTLENFTKDSRLSKEAVFSYKRTIYTVGFILFAFATFAFFSKFQKELFIKI